MSKSKIWPFISLDTWKSRGLPRAGDHLRQYTRDLLETLTCPEDHDDILGRGTDFIKAGNASLQQ